MCLHNIMCMIMQNDTLSYALYCMDNMSKCTVILNLTSSSISVYMRVRTCTCTFKEKALPECVYK